MQVLLLQPELRAHAGEENVDVITSIVAKYKNRISGSDLLVLPEHWFFAEDAGLYHEALAEISRLAGCFVVGGSHHRASETVRVNAGSVVDSGGKLIATYEKMRPYSAEQSRVTPGSSFGEFQCGGFNILVLICADFWYSDLILRVGIQPDIILVTALSVSRKSDPAYSASLWRHMAISRAYEFGAFVGISDWDKNSALPKFRTCGVGGFADPTQTNPMNFFQPVSDQGISSYAPDLEALREFRDDRRARGFFWK